MLDFDTLPQPPDRVQRDRARARSANVTAVLGPTNTGKTHFAIERMVAHSSGIIGLPLRLLAREVYNRLIEKVGVNQVALITGEEKIKPPHPRFWVATVEAMPRDLDVAFVAIDEIQIAANLDRGHTFTDRLLHRRGREETLLIGAGTMEKSIRRLLPQATIIERPRLSKLTFAGERKLSRMPRRSAIVAFSAEEVYAIAELIRRQRGGAAVVMGALSPRTRNAQVELYQNGDVDYLIATDAIGMGLNLDLEHIAFAGDRKFDGWQFRRLNPAEFGQIAGRAGRHLRDGTFGTTGRCPPMDEELVEAIEEHRFDPVGILQWRNSDLDFSSIRGLQASLERIPEEAGLTRAPLAEDVMVLDVLARDVDVQRQSKTRADVARLWEVCQVPDYRKVSPAAHAELVHSLYGFVVRAGRIPDSWFATHLDHLDRTDGDIDTLSHRVAQTRTLAFIANRPDWLRDPEHWQGVTRQVEDKLSDALHERLTLRFIDRRTSVLMRRLRENAIMEAEITASGDVRVEGQHVGSLQGFRFTADPQASGEAARTLNAAAAKALASEIEARAGRFGESVDESIALANDGTFRWLGDPVAKLTAGDKLLAPRARLLADEHLTGPALEQVQRRLDLWLTQHIKKLLGVLIDLETGEGLEGAARGLAFQLAESLGVLERARVAEEVKTLDQAARGILRKLGIRFGAYHIYMPLLLKPAPRALASQLWALQHGGVETAKGLDEVPYMAASGRTSFPADSAVPKGLYRAAGFRVCGARAVRVDILERLADLIRPAIAYRPGITAGAPPSGTADQDGFITTVAMTSLAGCSGEDFASILRSLGYVSDKRAGPAITVPLIEAAPTAPLRPKPAVETEPSNEAEAVETTDAGRDPAEPVPAVPNEEPPATVPDAPREEPPHPDEDEPPASPEDEPDPISEPDGPDGAPVPMQAHSDAAVDEPPGHDVVDTPEPAVEAEPAQAEVNATAQAEPDLGGASHAAAEPDQAADVEAVAETAATLETEAALPVADAVEAEPSEPVLIEVWRPHRANHGGQRRQDRGNGRPQQARRGGEHRGNRGPGQRPAEAPDGALAVAAPVGERPQDGGRPRRPDPAPGGGRGPTSEKRFGNGPGPRPEGDQQAGKGRHDPRRERGGRPEGRPNAGGKPASWSSAEPRPARERQADPNSPFAKLAALKADLESKTKKD
ncbi:helicase-related protein [Lichenihabitans sp. Uapishka_5]|uniref:helicase-related protein n=1 Tax=Lichenihabitans sp. Uapishka_5 TaxID=3037302 RepID=UPI0029E7FCFA|nr:helicase-related protein [Lichenihabitans sp. Uapishka_5]MDX7951602.1 helicase-related protein [Lichenihabitans sp. Uapishka_5]